MALMMKMADVMCHVAWYVFFFRLLFFFFVDEDFAFLPATTSYASDRKKEGWMHGRTVKVSTQGMRADVC